MAGSAMLAIAVSSDASASAVKIAATAQRLSSGGKPSIPGLAGGFAVVTSDILIGLSTHGAAAPTAACTTDPGQPTGTPLHDAYAKRAAENEGIARRLARYASFCGISAADFLLLPARHPID